MERYRSAGVRTIAALMAIDATGADRSRSAASESPANHQPVTAGDSGARPAPACGMERDFSQIARRCERAVITAYRDLRTHGTGDLPAFQACTTLYRIHHPEASLSEARHIVAEWIDHHLVRGEDGSAPGCDCDESCAIPTD